MSFLTERYFQILESHRLYTALTRREALATFTEYHVVCAWSYNALLRSLQRDIFTQSLPINSDAHKEAIRILSEVAIEEQANESDDGQFISHLELYLDAMEDLGANTAPIIGFFDILAGGVGAAKAVEYADFCPEVAAYARTTVRLLERQFHERAAGLFYEGEYFIPDRFLHQLNRLTPAVPVDRLLEYFDGHIEGLKRPGYSAAGRLVEIFTADDEILSEEAEQVGEQVMRQRVHLWNTVYDLVASQPEEMSPVPPINRSHLALVPY